VKKLLLLHFIFLSVSAAAQDTLIDILPHAGWNRQEISVFTEYYFASNSITNGFAKTYFLNRFIDNDVKDLVKLSDKNRIGGGFNYGIRYTSKSDSLFGMRESFFSIGFITRNHIDSKFNRDLFNVYFRGNKNYEDRTADLGDFIYRQYAFQRLDFTYGHQFKRGLNKFEWTAGLVLNKGQKFYRIESPKATLYTAPYGDYLDIDASLTMRQSDSAKKSWGAFNGLGLSTDMSFSWKDKNKNILAIKVSDLGFINWNDQTSYIHADSTFRYEGIDIGDLFDLSDSITETISVDSSLVEPFLVNRTKKNYTSILPGKINLSYLYILSPDRTDIEAGVEYMIEASYFPLAHSAIGYHVNQQNRIIVRIQYGGYSEFNAGLGYQLKLNTGWKFLLQSNYLTGILLKNGTGQGAFVSLSKSF
jgi:hypothetical protein